MTILRSPASHLTFTSQAEYRDHLKEVAVRNWEMRQRGMLLPSRAEDRRRRRAYVEARETVQRQHSLVDIFAAANDALPAAVQAPYIERYSAAGLPDAGFVIDGRRKPKWCTAINRAPLTLNSQPYLDGNGWQVQGEMVIHTPRIIAYAEALTLLGLHVVEFTFVKQEGRDYHFTVTCALRAIDFPQLHMKLALEGKIDV